MLDKEKLETVHAHLRHLYSVIDNRLYDGY